MRIQIRIRIRIRNPGCVENSCLNGLTMLCLLSRHNFFCVKNCFVYFFNQIIFLLTGGTPSTHVCLPCGVSRRGVYLLRLNLSQGRILMRSSILIRTCGIYRDPDSRDFLKSNLSSCICTWKVFSLFMNMFHFWIPILTRLIGPWILDPDPRSK